MKEKEQILSLTLREDIVMNKRIRKKKMSKICAFKGLNACEHNCKHCNRFISKYTAKNIINGYFVTMEVISQIMKDIIESRKNKEENKDEIL